MKVTYCDLCEKPMNKRLVVKDGKKVVCTIVGRAVVNGRWKTIDVCPDCLKSAKQET